MGFFDFFRPTWKHSDPQIRSVAVRELRDDQTSTLVQIIKKDPELSIRKLAIQKIKDIQAVRQLLAEESTEELKERMQEKLLMLLLPQLSSEENKDSSIAALTSLRDPAALVTIILESKQMDICFKALDLLSNQTHLLEVVKKSSHLELKKKALAQIDKISLLRDLLLGSVDNELASLALLQIQDRNVLEEISKKASKPVRQLVQDRMVLLPETKLSQELSSDKKREKAQKLSKILEAALSSPDLDQANERIVDAQKLFVSLMLNHEIPAEQELIQKFERLFAQFQQRKKVALQRLDQERHLEKQRQLRLQLCDEIESFIEQGDLKQAKQIMATWKNVGSVPAIFSDLNDRFLKSVAQLKEKSARALQIDAAVAPLAPVNGTAEKKARSQQKGTRFQQETVSFQRKTAASTKDNAAPEDYQEQIQSLDQIRKNLENDLPSLSKKQVEQRIKEWEEVFQSIEALPKGMQIPIQNQFRKVREALVIRLQEWKEADEWKAWSQITALEQLWKRFEALQTESDSKQMFAAWKEIAPLWKTLRKRNWKEKGAELKEKIEQAYQALQVKVTAYQETLQTERAENAKKKEALCVQAETWADSSSWKEATEHLKELQVEWKKIGPVPMEQKQILFDRFQTACNRFFAKRKEQQAQKKAENQVRYQKKEALCRQAESLMDSTDFKKTTSVLKNLQSEWKEVGGLPKAQEEDLWQRFRKACDHFFSKKAALSQEKKSQQAESIKKREALVQEVTNLLPIKADPTPDQVKEIYAALKKAKTDWKELDIIPAEQGKKWEADFWSACEKAFQSYAPFFSVKEKTDLGKEFSRFQNKIQIKIEPSSEG